MDVSADGLVDVTHYASASDGHVHFLQPQYYADAAIGVVVAVDDGAAAVVDDVAVVVVALSDDGLLLRLIGYFVDQRQYHQPTTRKK